jgi:hypothetical protein
VQPLQPLSYHAPLRPPVTTALVGVLLLAGIFRLTLSLAQHGPWEFMALWLLVVGIAGYGILERTCNSIVIQDGRLSWWSAFSHGEMVMDQAVRVTAWPGGSVHVFEFRNGAKVRVAVMQGYLPFLQQLHETYSELSLPADTYARLINKVSVRDSDTRG